MALPKKNRLGAKSIAEIFKRGVIVQGSGMTLRYMRIATPGCAIVPVVSKSVSVSAVKRNRIRRVIQEEIRRSSSRIQEGVFGVVIIKNRQTLPTDIRRRDILALLEKSAILNK